MNVPQMDLFTLNSMLSKRLPLVLVDDYYNGENYKYFFTLNCRVSARLFLDVLFLFRPDQNVMSPASCFKMASQQMTLRSPSGLFRQPILVLT